jgi:citrate lyase subunit gamma (acyl carrier protein)
MKITKKAQAGSFESSDILILVEPYEEGKGRNIQLESAVFHQYGDRIKSIIIDYLDKYKLEDIHLVANDKGAIDAVISARMETVLQRATNTQTGTLY